MVRVIFGGQVFCQLMNLSVLSKDLMNSEPPLCNLGYIPDLSLKGGREMPNIFYKILIVTMEYSNPQANILYQGIKY